MASSKMSRVLGGSFLLKARDVGIQNEIENKVEQGSVELVSKTKHAAHHYDRVRWVVSHDIRIFIRFKPNIDRI